MLFDVVCFYVVGSSRKTTFGFANREIAMLSFLFIPALKVLTTEFLCSLRGSPMSSRACSMAAGSSSGLIPLSRPTSSKCSGAVRSGYSKSIYKIKKCECI